ncbi:MAG: methylmalonyl Co-A mutase-associated GTPase MeaB [Gemmatimonadetes bacterium]|nr:methylmalonyl Co-A mutase-associated GTPase MeaB [Gemmatimonadota bacterium]
MPTPLGDAQRALLDRFTAGELTALARLISLVENGRDGFEALLDVLHPRLGRAHRIGITGPPGAGKSTLTAGLIRHYRAQGLRGGAVAVDPTSPFTGGALLGDRIRMNDVARDPGVFIRSMATRGALGGLALTTREVADVLDAFGFERVIIETVGVGQSELDIAAAADTTVVVLVPESGDSIQTMKAGLMEAADVFVVNKADRPGADRLARELSMMLHLRLGQLLRNIPAHHGVDLRRTAAPSGPVPAAAPTAPSDSWEIPVLRTTAETGAGVPELAALIGAHAEWLDRSGQRRRRRRQRLAERVREQVGRRLHALAWAERGGAAVLEEALPALEAGEVSPYQVAAGIVRAAVPE